MANINFHDAKVIGLSYDELNCKLKVQIELSINKELSIEFDQVESWDFSPFEEQNILFDIQEFSSENIPEWFISDFNIPQEYAKLVNSGAKKILPRTFCGSWWLYILSKE